MNRGINIGDLVYVPSDVNLYKPDTKLAAPTPVETLKTKSPTNLLVVGIHQKGKFIGVHYLGELWLVNEKDVYL